MDSPAEDSSSSPPEQQAADGPSTASYEGSIPASPKLSKATPIINRFDLSFRRADPDLLFFAEPDAEERDGPLPEPRGLLTDIAQIFEAMDCGFADQAPLSAQAMDHVMADIINRIVADGGDQFDILINNVTDFEQLAFTIATAAETYEEELERLDSAPTAGPHSPH